MSKMVFWAIRHKPTGGYLPEPTGRMGRGGSHVEPVLHVDRMTEPRLFHTERAAKTALGTWLKGKVHHSAGYSCSGPDFLEEYYEELSTEHVPSRVREEMEIVPLEVNVP